MKQYIFLSGVALCLFSCKPTQQNLIKETIPETFDPVPYANTITSGELKTMLYTYASDDFEGRETGEPGQKKAVNYLKNHYTNLGISSPLAGNDYFQKVPLERQYVPEVNLYINGNRSIVYGDFVSMGSVDSQYISENDIVYAGYGIDSENYSDYKTIDVKDKVVLVKAGEPLNKDGNFITTGTKTTSIWTKGRRARNKKKEVAEKKGAKAFIIIDDEAFDYYARYYRKIETTNKQGAISLTSNTIKMPLLIINERFAKIIYNNILSDDTSKTIHSSIDLSIKKRVSQVVDSENVVAFIKGSEKPDEILVISAHLDHEGIRGDAVYNGADDDGSGTVALLEMAEAFKMAVNNGHGPKRSILFLHVTAEEKGLLGSKHYTDNAPVFPLENTVANLNIDMIGRVDEKHKDNKNYVYLIGSDRLSTELHNVSEAMNSKYINLNLDYTYNDENDKNRFYYRSDHYNFAKHNVPVIFYYNNTHADYHKPTDTPDKIEYDLLETRSRLIFYTAWELANREHRIRLDEKHIIRGTE